MPENEGEMLSWKVVAKSCILRWAYNSFFARDENMKDKTEKLKFIH